MLNSLAKLLGGFAETLGNLLLFVALPLFLALWLASARREAAHEAAIDQRGRQVAALAADLDGQFRNLGPMIGAFQRPCADGKPCKTRVDIANRSLGRFHIFYDRSIPLTAKRPKRSTKASSQVKGSAAAADRSTPPAGPPRRSLLLDRGVTLASWSNYNAQGTMGAPPVVGVLNDYRMDRILDNWNSRGNFDSLTLVEDCADPSCGEAHSGAELTTSDLRPLGTAQADAAGATDFGKATAAIRALLPGQDGVLPNRRNQLGCRFVADRAVLNRPCLAEALLPTGRMLVFVQPFHTLRWSALRPAGAAARAGPADITPGSNDGPNAVVKLALLAAVEEGRLSDEYADGPPLLNFALVVIVVTIIALAAFLRVRFVEVTWSYGSGWLASILAAIASLVGVAAALVACILAYAVEDARLQSASTATAAALAGAVGQDLQGLHRAAAGTSLGQACQAGGPLDNETRTDTPDPTRYPPIRTQTGIRFEGYSVPAACLTLDQLDRRRFAGDFVDRPGTGRRDIAFWETSKACNFTAKTRAYFDELLRGSETTTIDGQRYALEMVRSRTQGDVQAVLVRHCAEVPQFMPRGGVRIFGVIASTDLPSWLTAVTPPDIITALVVAPNKGSVPAGTVVAHSERWRALDTRFGDDFGSDQDTRQAVEQFLVAPGRGAAFTEGADRRWFTGVPVRQGAAYATPWVALAGYSTAAVERHAAAVGLAVLWRVGLGFLLVAAVLCVMTWAWRPDEGWIARLWPAAETATTPAAAEQQVRHFFCIAGIATVVTVSFWSLAMMLDGGLAPVGLELLCYVVAAAVAAEAMRRIRAWPAGQTQPPAGVRTYPRLVIATATMLMLPAVVFGLCLGWRDEQQADGQRRQAALAIAVEARQHELAAALATYAPNRFHDVGLSRYPARSGSAGLGFEAGDGAPRLVGDLDPLAVLSANWAILLGLPFVLALYGSLIWLCAGVVGRSMLGLSVRAAPEPKVATPSGDDLKKDLTVEPAKRRFRRVMLVETDAETLAAWQSAARAAFSGAVVVTDLATLIKSGTDAPALLTLGPATPSVLILDHIETLFGSQALRLGILGQLEALADNPTMADCMIWLVMPYAPLDRIAAANERDKRIMPDLEPAAAKAWAVVRRTSNEVYRWSALLQQFRSVIVPVRPAVPAGAPEPVLAREYRAIDDPHLPPLAPATATQAEYLQHFDWQSLPEEQDQPTILARQFAEYFRRAYMLRTDEERLILRALAYGQWVRTDTIAFASLLASGIVVMAPWPKLASEAWAVFLKNAESDEALQERAERVDKGSWPRIQRIALPSVATLALLLAFSNAEFAKLLVPLVSAAAYLWRGAADPKLPGPAR